jgi:uncharacterized membrane protein YgdD (TMEM256/DUF423 family)
LAFSAIAHHSQKIDEITRISMHRAVSIHQLSGLGFIIMAACYDEIPVLSFGVLIIATALFPGVIYYQSLTKEKSIFGRFVPLGGLLHMAFWLSICVFRPIKK